MDKAEMRVEEGCVVTCHKYKYDRSIKGLTRQLTKRGMDGQTNTPLIDRCANVQQMCVDFYVHLFGFKVAVAKVKQ